MTLSVKNMCFSYGERTVLDDVSFEARSGEITAIVGPNGSGKTTLLKCIAGILGHRGRILFDGEELDRLSTVERLSYMEQNTDCNVNINVFEAVLLGMIGDLGFRVTNDNISDVEKVLQRVGISDLAESRMSEISGGQRQLVFIAQALVKNPEVLLLDEPTSALDLFNRYKLMDFLKDITNERRCTTVVTLHHLDVAMKYADHVVVISNKRVYVDGTPEEAFTERMLREVYRTDSEFVYDEAGNRHLLILGPIYRSGTRLIPNRYPGEQNVQNRNLWKRRDWEIHDHIEHLLHPVLARGADHTDRMRSKTRFDEIASRRNIPDHGAGLSA